MKQPVSKLHDVVFREAGDLLTAVSAGVFKGVAHDLFRTRTRNQLEALHHLLGLAVLDAGIKIFFVLSNNHHIHYRVLRFHEGVIGHAGPNVGIKAERLAHGDVQALVAATLRRGNRRFKENFCAAQRVPGAWLYPGAVPGQINFLADFYCFNLEVSAGCFENVESCRHDLRPDAIAMCDGNGNRFGHIANMTFRELVNLERSNIFQAAGHKQSGVCQRPIILATI